MVPTILGYLQLVYVLFPAFHGNRDPDEADQAQGRLSDVREGRREGTRRATTRKQRPAARAGVTVTIPSALAGHGRGRM